MFKLIYNENLKLYWRKDTLLMLVSLMLMAVFSSMILRRYDIDPGRQNFWDAASGQLWLMILVNIFSAVVASGIVANEFRWGTVKLLLIRPYSRSKILLSKYITVLLFSTLLTGIIVVFSGVTNAFLYHKPPSLNSFSILLELFALKHVDVLVYATLAFMLSVVSRSSSVALGFSLVAVFFGPIVAYYLPSKYLLFSQLDLTRYYKPEEGLQVVGIAFSSLVLASYTLLFYIVSWVAFLKRDVGN